MLYAERSYAGPDIFGQVFAAEPAQHCAARDEHRRLAAITDRLRRHRRAARG
jgi:hypothetical protein